MTRPLVVRLIGDLPQPELDQLTSLLGLTRHGRLSDDEDFEFGRRYLKREQNDRTLLTLDRIDRAHWQIVLSYQKETPSPDLVERVRSEAVTADRQVGLTIERTV